MDLTAEAGRQWLHHGWADAALGMEAVVALVRVHQILLSRAEVVLRDFGLTFARFEILRALAFTASGSMTISSLSRALQVHPTTVSKTVQRMEAQGLVCRTRGGYDRREVYASITSRARDLVERATTDLNEGVFSDFGLTSRQHDALWSTLKRFRANAGDFAPTGSMH